MSWYKKIKEETHGTYPSGGSNTYGKSRADAGHSFVPKSSDCDCGKSPCDCGKPVAKHTSSAVIGADKHNKKHEANPEWEHKERNFKKNLEKTTEAIATAGDGVTTFVDEKLVPGYQELKAKAGGKLKRGLGIDTKIPPRDEDGNLIDNTPVDDNTPPTKNLKGQVKKGLKKYVQPKLKVIEAINSAAVAARRVLKK